VPLFPFALPGLIDNEVSFGIILREIDTHYMYDLTLFKRTDGDFYHKLPKNIY
jgi:hypothetical protein